MGRDRRRRSGLHEEPGSWCRRVGRVVCTAVAVGLAWAASADLAQAQLGALLSPGKLARAHAQLEGIDNCQKCHEQGRKATPEKCLTCHKAVADRIGRRAGVHKDVRGDCGVCHSEHAGIDGELRPFDPQQFDHREDAGFPLTGKHAKVAADCAACHKVRSFLTLSSACASCHTDVHKGALGNNCASCHSTQVAFTDVGDRFDHTKTRFTLTGAHRAVACANCHVNKTFKGLKFTACTDCHRDPHVQKFGSSCTSCHTSDSWRTKRVDHARTSFPLLGRHAITDCAACHKQPAMKVTPRSATCASCHVDVHRGTFKQDCKACHTETGFGKAPFDHSGTAFPLSGQHVGLACQKCHTSASVTGRTTRTKVADYRGLTGACVSCHADVHRAELGTACESCHSTSTFALSTYAHRGHPEFFTGPHGSPPCSKCHQPEAPTRPVRTGAPASTARFAQATTSCVSCHADVHLGQLGTRCETCHAVKTSGFASSSFVHDSKTAFPLTGRHAEVACAACHKLETGAFPAGVGTTRRLKGVPTDCQGCHADVHLGQLGPRCESCHQATSFKLANFQHKRGAQSAFFTGRHLRATCDSCHKRVTARFPSGEGTAIRFTVESACVSCHRDVHQGSLGSDCIRCHRP